MAGHSILLLLLHFFLSGVPLDSHELHFSLSSVHLGHMHTRGIWELENVRFPKHLRKSLNVSCSCSPSLHHSEWSKAGFPSLGQWNSSSPWGLSRAEKGEVPGSLPPGPVVVTCPWAWESLSCSGLERSLDISSPVFVEVLGAVLIWRKETVSWEGLGKQTTAQQNKNTKENTPVTLWC